ncbi:MAG: hypothetical protein WC517_03135 [Patescibacteria group bacterium]
MNIEKIGGDVVIDLYAGTVPLPGLFYDMNRLATLDVGTQEADSPVYIVYDGPYPYYWYNYPYPGYPNYPNCCYAVDAECDDESVPAYNESQVCWGVALQFDCDEIPLTVLTDVFERGTSLRINLSDYVPDRVQENVRIFIVATYPGMRPEYYPAILAPRQSGTFCWAKFTHFLMSVNGEMVSEAVGEDGLGLGFIEIEWPFLPPIERFELSTNAEGEGIITGGGVYDSGTEVTVSATPADGWSFDYWVVNGEDSAINPGIVTMDSNVELIAVFTEKPVVVDEYTLTTSVTGHGTVSGAGTYDVGEVVTVTALPEANWTFNHWVVNGATGSTNPIAQVTMDSDVLVTGVFVQNTIPVIQYTLAANVSGQGSVSGAGVYDAGTVVAITATPAVGWHFDHWVISGDVVGGSNPGSVLMNANVTLMAVFIQDSPVDTTGKLIVDLTTAAGIVSFKADAPDGYTAATFGGIGDQSQIQSVGLQIYYMSAVGGLWTNRETFAFSGTWPMTGVLTKVSGKTLRFEIVANSTGGWGDPEKIVVRLNGALVPRVTDNSGNTAFQVILP